MRLLQIVFCRDASWRPDLKITTGAVCKMLWDLFFNLIKPHGSAPQAFESPVLRILYSKYDRRCASAHLQPPKSPWTHKTPWKIHEQKRSPRSLQIRFHRLFIHRKQQLFTMRTQKEQTERGKTYYRITHLRVFLILPSWWRSPPIIPHYLLPANAPRSSFLTVT